MPILGTIVVIDSSYFTSLSCGLKIMAGAEAVAGAAAAAVMLPLLFSSFSAVDKAHELLTCWIAISCMGWWASLSRTKSHNYFYCLFV